MRCGPPEPNHILTSNDHTKSMQIQAWILILFFTMSLIPISFQPVFAQQTVNVTSSDPCFLNYTASWELLENCQADQDYLVWVLGGWEWMSGGYFSMIIVSVIIGATYMKYKEIIYPIFIGVIFLPISFFVFPNVFLSWGVIMAFVGIGVLMWWIFIKQTN